MPDIKNRPNVIDVVIGTGFGAGFWPWGPGTAGAALATLIWCLYSGALAGLGMPVVCSSYQEVLCVTAMLAVVSTLASIAPINRLEKHWGADPSRVVVDEMAGVWVTLLAVPATMEWQYVLGAFLLFRIMDIVKPLGCRWLDKNIHGGWGVMLDDILAGVYGAVALWGIRTVAEMWW
ncbi:phosphatidylglycerophosphatase A [Palleniella muris]|uniref:Phosphatidylglycerophosphatase A n=1 Tax=Palleniella muris TaxID=3038145 RepID=A0AC61QMJ8_9BACT|nr:phosphatidylglycerophosphatase A [Palleniella muris]TGX80453.1 phosphatidylglycerophosphatase A [Palleniella muris]